MANSISLLHGTIIVSLFLFSIISILLLLLWFSWKRDRFHGSVCPYTQSKLKLGADIAKSIQTYVNAQLAEYNSPDNPPIDFTKAAISECTGRIFPNCVTSGDRIQLQWDFIQKRVAEKGVYVSWGALPEGERSILTLLHTSFDGFQLQQSSSKVQPQHVEREYALLSPGPLYVDRRTKIIVGWKKIFGTNFEVLIVQRPVFENIDETL